MTPPPGWEAQNCFLTAGDTRKLNFLEITGMKKGDGMDAEKRNFIGRKQPASGYIIGKILGEIGHDASAVIADRVLDQKVYGLESMTGLRNCAVHLYLIAKNLETKSVDEQKKALQKKEENGASELSLPISEIKNAREKYKNMVKKNITDKFKLNVKNIHQILNDGCSYETHTHLKTFRECDPSPCPWDNAKGGRKRRRRKRRTRRGGKSRRRKRTRRRRRR